MEISSSKVQSSKRVQNTASKKTIFDLEERTAVFGENIIILCKSLPQDVITKPLISQIIRSGTSIGANYAEANNASSKKDFRNKVYIAKKEAQETKHWLRMLRTAAPNAATILDDLDHENHQLCLILQSIAHKVSPAKDV